MPRPVAHAHLGEMITETVAAHPSRPALRERVDDAWKVITYRELQERVDAVATALIERGVRYGDRVAIFSRNRPAWTVVDLAAIGIGAVVVPIYQTSTPKQARHILADSATSVVFAEGADEADRIAQVRHELPDLVDVITFDPVDGHTGYTDLIATTPDADTLTTRRAQVSGNDVASIIYTSGTTGDPKGVVLSHGAFTSEIAAVLSFFDITEHDHSLCFLPLAHALERAWTFVVLTVGAMNTYWSDARTVADAMPLARPTLMVSVPRLYEKVYSVAHEQAAASPLKNRIFTWAVATGRRAQAAGRHRGPWLNAQLRLADRLVLRNIREAIGGPKTVLASGGAPLRQEVEEFFHAAGILVCQGYGLTEAAPLISFNSPDAFRFGTVGRVMPGSEFRIGDEGEILYRGPNVMLGYHNLPDATAESMTEDGWLRTGDIGEIDADGFLTITDRMKDIIVTAGGKNVAPGPIEGELASDPLIEYAVVLGDNRPCLTVLVRPNLPGLEGFAKQAAIAFDDAHELLSHERITEEIRARIAKVSEGLANHEKIREFEVIEDDMTMENGMLTPTLKVRRRAVEQKFRDKVESMYERIRTRRK